MRRLLLAAVFVVGCAPRSKPAPAAEVPVASVSAAAAATAPPSGPPQLPSSLQRKRPMTDAECRQYLGNVIDHLADVPSDAPQLRAERRAQVMLTLADDLERCRKTPVTDAEVKCVLSAPNPTDIHHCSAE